MSRFPTPGHLASWARFAPGINSSAGKTKGTGSTGHGNRYLARVLGEVAVAAGGTDTFLGARYRRIARRRVDLGLPYRQLRTVPGQVRQGRQAEEPAPQYTPGDS
jgi:transposase